MKTIPHLITYIFAPLISSFASAVTSSRDHIKEKPWKSSLSDKGTMIRACSHYWCHLFSSVWLDNGKEKQNLGVANLLHTSIFFSWCGNNPHPTTTSLLLKVKVHSIWVSSVSVWEPNPLNWQVPCLQRKLNLCSSFTHTQTDVQQWNLSELNCNLSLSLVFFFSWASQWIFVRTPIYLFIYFWQSRFRSAKWPAMCVLISRFLQRSAPLLHTD